MTVRYAGYPNDDRLIRETTRPLNPDHALPNQPPSDTATPRPPETTRTLHVSRTYPGTGRVPAHVEGYLHRRYQPTHASISDDVLWRMYANRERAWHNGYALGLLSGVLVVVALVLVALGLG